MAMMSSSSKTALKFSANVLISFMFSSFRAFGSSGGRSGNGFVVYKFIRGKTLDVSDLRKIRVDLLLFEQWCQLQQLLSVSNDSFRWFEPFMLSHLADDHDLEYVEHYFLKTFSGYIECY